MENKNDDFVSKIIKLREDGKSTNDIIELIKNSGMSIEDTLNLFIEECDAIVSYKVQKGGEAAQDIVDALTTASYYDDIALKNKEHREELEDKARKDGVVPRM